jgi:hypothetical protein
MGSRQTGAIPINFAIILKEGGNFGFSFLKVSAQYFFSWLVSAQNKYQW